MPVSVLPISGLIQVAISLAPQAAQSQNLNSLLVMGPSAIIDPVTRMRSYSSLAEVAGDFGTSAPEYLAAVLWFEQNGGGGIPASLNIGRWVNAASSGQLFGAPLSAAQQAIANWTAVGAEGGFTISVDGTAQHVTGVNLSAVTNLNGVASAINAVLTGATCAWNSVYQNFVFTSTATGASSTLSFLTVATSGTDISVMLGGAAVTGNGAYTVPGQVAESALAAVTLLDSMFGQQWFGIEVLGAADADHEAIAPYIEASANFHYYFLTTQEAGVLVGNYTTDIAYILSQLGYQRTFVQFSSTNPYAVTSAAARILTTNYNGNNTVIDLMYKQEPGITPENLNSVQAAAAQAKQANVLAAYDNNTAIIQYGNSCSGLPAALVIGAMAFGVQLQTDLFNELYLSTTKVPQSDGGMHTLGTVIENDCTQFVNNGFFAPGTWTSSTVFGTLYQNKYLAKGYYLYTPAVATQSSASRAAGNSVPFQLAAKFSGNVRNVNLAVTINQ